MDLKRIRELSKALTESQEKPENKIMYGTVISSDEDGIVVQLDGTDVEIPVNSIVEVHEYDRVQIQFNQHEAIITGNVSDKSITRTDADGLIDIYADDGTFSGTLSAPTGNIGGWSLTNSAFYRGSSTWKDADGMYFGSNGLSIKDKFSVASNGTMTAYSGIFYGNNDKIRMQITDAINVSDENVYSDIAADAPTLLRVTNTQNTSSGSKIMRVAITGERIRMYDEYSDKTISIRQDAGRLVLGAATFTDVRSDLYVTGEIKGYNTSNSARSLIRMTGGNNVQINGDQSGITNISTDTGITGTLSASGDVKSTGGALVANNCTTYNAGVAGGFITDGGRLGLVSGSSSIYPQIIFVTNKSTTRYTQLRSNNTSGTYTLTLPNSTGTLATSSSDVRLKENIKPSKVSGLDLINKIELKQFDWKAEAREGAPHWKIGMIADELEELDENLTFGGGENEDGSMNVKGIETTCIISYLVKAVQELSQEIQELKQRGG